MLCQTYFPVSIKWGEKVSFIRKKNYENKQKLNNFDEKSSSYYMHAKHKKVWVTFYLVPYTLHLILAQIPKGGGIFFILRNLFLWLAQLLLSFRNLFLWLRHRQLLLRNLFWPKIAKINSARIASAKKFLPLR